MPETQAPSVRVTTFAGKKAIVIAEASRIKLILSSIPWALMGVPLLICGPWMAVSEALYTHDRETVIMGCCLALAGWVLTGFMACRLRAAFDSRIEFIAGPGGARLAFPSAPQLRRLFMTYRINTYDFRAADIFECYPRDFRVNGLLLGSEVIINVRGGTLKVDSKFFNDSADSLAWNLQRALSDWKDSRQK